MSGSSPPCTKCGRLVNSGTFFRVSVQPDEDRFYAEVPVLPGCHSWGYTYEEALKNIKEAVELWLEVKREQGSRSHWNRPRRSVVPS